MALPSARRPAAVQRLLEEESPQFFQKSLPSLRMKLNLHDVFLDSMASWYEYLETTKKRTLTPLKLKRIAVHKCFELNYNYDHLPDDWISTLRERCGLRLFDKKRSYTFFVSKDTAVPTSVFEVDNNANEDPSIPRKTPDPDVPKNTNSPCPKNVLVSGHVDNTNMPSLPVGVMKTAKYIAQKRMSTESLSDSEDAPSPKIFRPRKYLDVSQEKMDSPAESRRKASWKKFEDLTKMPPPPKWLEAIAYGIYVPRTLRLYSGDDVNVLFYEYDMEVLEKIEIPKPWKKAIPRNKSKQMYQIVTPPKEFFTHFGNQNGSAYESGVDFVNSGSEICCYSKYPPSLNFHGIEVFCDSVTAGYTDQLKALGYPVPNNVDALPDYKGQPPKALFSKNHEIPKNN